MGLSTPGGGPGISTMPNRLEKSQGVATKCTLCPPGFEKRAKLFFASWRSLESVSCCGQGACYTRLIHIIDEEANAY